MAITGGHQNFAPIFRTDSNLSTYSFSTTSTFFPDSISSSNRKRQLFLRSYQFSRKKSFSDKLKSSLSRARRAISLRLKSARRIRRFVWSGLRSALCLRNRRRRLSPCGRNWLFGGRSKRKVENYWEDSAFWYKRIN